MASTPEAPVIQIRRPRQHTWVVKVHAEDRTGRTEDHEATVTAATVGDAIDEFPTHISDALIERDLVHLSFDVTRIPPPIAA